MAHPWIVLHSSCHIDNIGDLSTKKLDFEEITGQYRYPYYGE